MIKKHLLVTLLLLGGIFLSSCSSGEAISRSKQSDGIQHVNSKFEAREYASVEVKVGMPVYWEIEISEADLNGCNNEIELYEYGINKKLEVGKNIIEFTPEETGVFPYSCWMGMLRSEIRVVD